MTVAITVAKRKLIKVKTKRPYCVVSTELEWPSHRFILPNSIEALRRQGCRIVELPAHDVFRFLRDIVDNASHLVLMPPLNKTILVLVLLQQFFKRRPPALLFETSHAVFGGSIYFTYRKTLRLSDRIVTPSSAVARVVSQRQVKSKVVELIPWPVDTQLMKPMSIRARQRFRRGLGLKSQDKMLVYVGRLTPQKNITELLIAFAKVKSKHPSSKLFLLGSFASETSWFPSRESGSYQLTVEALVARLQLKEDVIFVGEASRIEVARYLGSCDVHVSLSTFFPEEYGYAIAEGLSCAAPTVVSGWGGGIDFIQSGAALGVGARLTGDGPRINRTMAIRQILRALEPSQNKRLRDRALVYSRENLTIECAGQRWRELFEKPFVLSSSPEGIELHKSFLQRSKARRRPLKTGRRYSIQALQRSRYKKFLSSVGHWYVTNCEGGDE
jgi:glycosyltransferase involved in cell wall biosynthesis